MKNVGRLFLLFSFGAVTFILFFVDTPKSLASGSVLKEDINSGLAEGEEVVDTFIDLSLDELNDELIDEEVFLENGDDLITPYERTLKWYGVDYAYQGLAYGPWNFAGASTISGGKLTASHTKTVSNRHYGNLKITLKSLESVVGFDTSRSWSETVGYVSDSYPNGKYRLEYRHVYKRYKVKQERKYDRRASNVYGTEFVYPQKWVERQYRVVKIN